MNRVVFRSFVVLILVALLDPQPIVVAADADTGAAAADVVVAELAAEDSGDLAHVLEGGSMQPLSLAVGDLDEDGLNDLVVGYGDGVDGLVTIHFGNAAAIYPRPGESAEPAFLSDARALSSDHPVDHLAVGDFDADGHFDVVTAAAGDAQLELRLGNGRGFFDSPASIELNGLVTAMVSGDVNRRDGLTDLVVGVDGWSGPRLLVFEWPGGALRAEPEVIALEESVRRVEIRRDDDDSLFDIVASSDLLETVVTGRDRRLSWGPAQRAAVPRASMASRPLSSSTTIKRGTPDQLIEVFGDAIVAHVEMRLNRDALPDSVVIVDGSEAPVVLTTKGRATFTVDSTADDPDFSTGDGVCDTDDGVGDGPCTLRAAIQQANTSAGADTIEFDIPGVGPHTIQPTSGLPTVTDAVTIDGFTQPGSSPNTIPYPGALDTTLMVDLDGSLVPPGANGFVLSGGATTIRGLVIRGFLFSGAWTGAGVRLDSSGHIVEGCFIGTDPSGTLDRGNEMGTLIYHGSNNLIGGSLPGARNLLSGNDRSHGVELYGFSGSAIGNMIQGNLVGTDISGTSGIAGDYSGTGISVTVSSAGGNWIGGSGPGEGNVISVPTQCSDAVHIYAGASTVVQGNLIGTNATGTAGIGSACNGVFAYDNAQDCTVGGTQPGAGNVISGNAGYGLFFREGGWTIQGNFIGVLADGITPLGNARSGIYLSSESDGPVGDLIGGDVAGAGNVIANNNYQGSDGSGVRLAFPQVGWPTPPSEHSFLGNSIFNNSGLGIDICSTEGCTEGPTPNDPGDPDTGSNYLQNYPVVSGVSSDGGAVDGSLNSTPSTTFRVEFFANSGCDASGYGEGEVFLGSDTVTTDAVGDVSFSSAVTVPVPVGAFVTATATDPAGNTSEFSQCFEYAPSADLQTTIVDGVTEVLPGDQLTYTIVASNLGPDAMSDATFQANLGYPMSCSTTCIPGGGATCSPGPILGDVEEQIFLPVGGTASYTAVCDVDFTAVGTLEVSAGIYPPAGAVDPDWNNNESTDINTILPVDWGDAPDPAYPTLPGSDGARHQIAGGLHLGAAADADPGGQPTPGADGDDTDGTDDEDGVTFTDIVMTGATASLEVSASAFGLLNAWIDLDGNGSWLDPGEQIFTDEPLGAGINPLSFPVTAAATPGDSFARFRFDSVGGLAPTGYAADGEVEDYLVEVRFSTLDIAKTGQTTSYAAGDDGTHQSGAPWPDPRFTDNGDGTLTDELTGLTWAQDSVNPGPAPCNPGVTRNWFLSLDYVDCLNSNSWLGHTDWRMPNIVELGSLVHYAENEQRPWWSAQGFAVTTNYRWWSSTTLPSSLGGAQTLSAFASFSNFGKLAVSGTAVWPVRGGDLGDGAIQLPETGQIRCWDDTYAEVPCAGTGQDGDHRAGAEWPTPRFEVSGECVTDRLTGLTWSRDANPFGLRSWQHALEDALGLSLCGYDDWRLPTTRELQTLYHFDKRWDIASPSLTEWWQDQGFTNVSSESAWTSTSHAGSPADVAWIAWSGYSKDTDDSLIVWPVRGGVHGDVADLAVAIADSDDPVMPGDPVVYSVDVSNLGPNTALEVSLTTVLPDGATFVSGSGAGWSCGEVDLVVTCTMASLSVGPAPQVSIEITAPTTPGTITATCFVDSALDDIVGDNNGDTEDTVVIGYDFGDALDPTYPTLLASNGARHLTGGSLYLGATVDSDPDGQPTANADGDDNDGTDDEDGVVFTSTASPGGTAGVDVEASEAGLLNAWVDFNADGDWDDTGEQIFTDEVLVAGVNTLTFSVPVDATAGIATVARFRVDSSGGLLPTGAASDGEVEDHLITIEELDFGDAPDPTFPTLLASNGARHLIDGVTYLGAAVDADPDGQPNANADGDDNDAQGDDEDGISYITWPVAGQLCTIRVTASTVGFVNAWIDYNADGDWADAGEHVFVDVAVVAGQNDLDYTIPITATTGVDTYARFRFSTSGGLSFDGPAPDGEVEDYKLGIVALDFGDAPDPSYPTLQGSDGARHIIDGGLFLGAGVDLEADGQPSVGADGDDLDGNDDEDGVVFTSGLGRGLDASLDVTASGAGLLNAWIDFNADGDWDDAGEQVFTDQPLAAGVNVLSLTVPAGATLGTTFARFRLDSNGGLSPSGYATDGEVEDHAVEIVEGPDLQIGIIASAAYVPSGDPLGYTITVTNNGPLTATSVSVTDSLPAELVFVSSNPGAPDCVFSAGTLTCDLGTMAPSDTALITIDTVLDHPVWGTVSSTSTVTAAELDPIQANNTASVDTPIALFVDDFESGDLSAWD